ncbi:MAG: cyclophilin family peptidyl-prolyl cis-trans isomerase/HEAT repeat protein [Planctomycetota bacterium]|jgi:cyclophilin family peptidyl-prolyl cis-trans isomerase/HEAT repeat protein
MRRATPLTSTILFSLSWTLLGCSSLSAISDAVKQTPRDLGQQTQLAGPASGALNAMDLGSNIARLEQSRATGGGYLQTLVQHDDPAVRLKATTALGRMRLDDYGRNVTGALEVALEDEIASVRRAAAFALGARGDISCTPDLIDAADDEDPDVRAQIWLALGRLKSTDTRSAGLQGLRDPAPAAQQAACLAIYYWPKESEQWALAGVGLANVAANGPEEARWMALFTLARREELRGDWIPFTSTLSNPKAPVLEHLFATLGLARAAQTVVDAQEAFGQQGDVLSEALSRSAMHADARVATEALRGLKTLGRGLAPRLREHVLQHASKHVRAAGLLALPLEARSMEYASALDQDPSPMVRRAAFAVVVQLNPAASVSFVRDWARSGDYRQRRAAASIANKLEANEAQGILFALLSDKHPQVVGAAIEGLVPLVNRATRARVRDYCGHKDNGISLAAINAIGEWEVTVADLPFLIEAYDQGVGDVGPEVRFNALLTAAKIKGKEPVDFLRVAVSDPDSYVSQVAKEQLTKRGEDIPTDLDPRRASLLAPETAPEFNLDLGNPSVSIETTRGTLVLELYPTAAATHVHSFLTLAAKGHYDGLTWHRVVSDFVVQGGCYRGDGNGSGTWRSPDDSLAQEFNPLPYAAGALGMPRNQNPDSGGNQIFITHRPTPHLDSRYTLFGQVVRGWDTLQEIEEGDLILEIRRLH